MTKKLTFLGIETSCDETAAAVIRENDNGTADILSNIVSSQIDEHKKFGGVVPELAARAHLENIEFIIDSALSESKVSIQQIDGVAATAGPGLIVCLTVGLNIGKSIAAFAQKPFIGVNHLEGHALSPGLVEKINFPYLLLLISGGHTQYLIVTSTNN
jgi:N6-L-threonylcarbamoyladenine synthase